MQITVEIDTDINEDVDIDTDTGTDRDMDINAIWIVCYQYNKKPASHSQPSGPFHLRVPHFQMQRGQIMGPLTFRVDLTIFKTGARYTPSSFPRLVRGVGSVLYSIW